MSVNIHKVLGYALTGITYGPDLENPGRERINDPRINPTSPLLFWAELEEQDEDFEVPDLAGYARWLESRQAPGDRSEARLIRDAVDKRRHCSPLTQAAVHDEESTFGDTLVLIPPTMLHRWYRSGDSIDWWESSLLPDGKGDCARLEFLPTGPSPYAGRFMDIDGTELNAEAARLKWLAREGLPGDELDHIASWIRCVDPAEHSQVYFSGADALARIVPYVPTGIRNLAEYGQLFTDPETWKSLRPVLYTYWT